MTHLSRDLEYYSLANRAHSEEAGEVFNVSLNNINGAACVLCDARGKLFLSKE